MVWKNLLFISVRDLLARKGRLLLTMMGITVGVMCLLFLLSLTAAIRKKIITEVLGTIPEKELQVTPAEVEFLGTLQRKLDAPILDDKQINRIKKSVAGIDKIYGVESLNVPAQIIWTLSVVGIESAPYQIDCAVSSMPRELIWEDPDHLKDTDGLDRPKDYIFKGDDAPVPMVLSTHLLEMYNMHFANVLNMPKLRDKTLRSWIRKQKFDLTIGESSMLTAPPLLGPFRCEVVGASQRAPIWGITVPPEYIRHWKKAHSGKEEPIVYQKLVVFAKSVKLVEKIEAELKKMRFDVVTNRETISKINTASIIINALVVVLGLIILVISAASIINILTMSVYEEATDIAILRSVGARKSHVRGIYLLKAGFIGLLGALDGLIIGLIAIGITNKLAEKYLQNLPYRPDTFFLPSVSLAVGCFLVGLVFSLAAGVIPANIAASLNPSKVLREG